MLDIHTYTYTWSIRAYLQVGSLSVGPGVAGSGQSQLLVAQAGGTYIPLVYVDKQTTTTDSENDGQE